MIFTKVSEGELSADTKEVSQRLWIKEFAAPSVVRVKIVEALRTVP